MVTIIQQHVEAQRNIYSRVNVVCDMVARTITITRKGQPFKLLDFRDVLAVEKINGHLKSAVVHEKLKPFESFALALVGGQEIKFFVKEKVAHRLWIYLFRKICKKTEEVYDIKPKPLVSRPGCV